MSEKNLFRKRPKSNSEAAVASSFRLWIAALLLLLGTIALPSSAEAALQACNQTEERVSVAIGYREDGEWVSEGWWVVPPGECKTVVGGELTLSHYYWRATAKNEDWEQSRFMFCTNREAFTIIGDTECQERGYSKAAFNEIKLSDGQADYTLTLENTRDAADAKQAELAVDAPGGAMNTTVPPADTGFPIGNRDARGTHGEPFTVTGILSKCELDGSSYACDLIGNGFRYVASPVHPTPFRLLEALEVHAFENPNTRMTWIGDMVFYEGTHAEVVLRQVKVENPGPFAELRDQLQGFWQSQTDSESQLLITGAEMTFFSEGLPMASSFFEIEKQKPDVCPGPVGVSGRYLIARDFGSPADEEPSCYDVVSVTGNTLTLFPVGAMRDLEFVRSD
ncbi:MAG: DUF1036 domain-containing protein [Pseudomonadota bacterium]